MSAPLILEFTIEGDDYSAAGAASNNIKNTLKMLGINSAICRRAAVILYEAEMNLVIHGGGGVIKAEINQQSVILHAIDHGKGISDIEKAMTEGYTTAGEQAREMGFGAGMGLPNMQRNSDNFEITSTVGKGTTIKALINFNN